MDVGGAPYRSLGIDAIFQYAGSGVQLFSGMIFYVIVARLFNSSGVGAIALFVAIIGLFSIIFTFGMNAAAQHFTSYNLGIGDYGSVKATIYKFITYGFCLSIGGLITLFAVAPMISMIFLHSSNYISLIRMLSVVLFGNIMYGILNGTLLGFQNFRMTAVINIIIWITYYFGAVAFAVFLKSINTIVFGWMIGICLGVAVELIFVIVSLMKYLGPGKAPTNMFIFSYSVPILLSGLISYGAASADRFVVSGILNLSSLGIYNFSLLISVSIGFLASPFNNILMPKFSELFGTGKDKEIKPTAMVSSTLLSSFYVPSALGIAAIAPLILYLLGGNEYELGAAPLRIIMFSTALFITQNILIQTIASVRKTRLLLYSSLLALIGNVLISFILIPRYGLDGAAIGYSSVFAITFSSLYYFAWKADLIDFDKIGLLKIWVASISMFFVVEVVSNILGLKLMFLPFYILLGAGVYLPMVRILRVFKKENKELILSLFPENYVRLKRVVKFLILY